MRQLTAKNYWPALTLLVVAIIIALGYFLIYSEIQNLKNTNIELDAKKQENLELSQKLTNLQMLKNAFASNATQSTTLSLALPQTNMMAEIIESLRVMAQDSVVEIISIKQSPQVEGKTQTFTSVDISFEGSYQSFRSFLQNIESNIRYAVPTKINISHNQNVSGGESYLKGTMSLNFFKVKTKSAPGVSSSPTTQEGDIQP